MKPVAILGVGPAGLMAAHAVALSGRPIALFSKPGEEGKIVKSKLGGAQFLHDPLPGVNDEDADVSITYRTMGDAAGYRAKVYGKDPTIPFVSMDNVHDGKQVEAWNLKRTYDALWDLLSADKANGVDVAPMWIDQAVERGWFDLIINSVPAHALCRSHNALIGEQHLFVSQSILIGNECIYEDLPDNTILYNGDPSYSWYRCSKIFGHEGTEWSEGPLYKFPMTDLVPVRKPIRTTCDCYPEILRVGRYGTWTKGVLTNHAFTAVLKEVS